ncbi:hypothetical protein AURDEDRAFT_177975 [Auricularia subglabra TFB-10046 SS5]|uniref:Uncharacterized protein n=1 Tax=Auricularia subglabra (strain TFB-10046 / SS5) TaxID=717982 RepID=J0WKY1_AURST|nr:hypothetical protein AURDEDRAFT_177975 [Auricularia subglabra TFB-10046 SS5]
MSWASTPSNLTEGIGSQSTSVPIVCSSVALWTGVRNLQSTRLSVVCFAHLCSSTSPRLEVPRGARLLPIPRREDAASANCVSFTAAPVVGVPPSLWRVSSLRIAVPASWRDRRPVVVVLSATTPSDGPQVLRLPLVRLLHDAQFRSVGALDIPSLVASLHGLSSVLPLFNDPWSALLDPSRLNTASSSRQSNCASRAGADAWAMRTSGANLDCMDRACPQSSGGDLFFPAPSFVFSVYCNAFVVRAPSVNCAAPADDKRLLVSTFVERRCGPLLNASFPRVLHASFGPVAPLLVVQFACLLDPSLARVLVAPVSLVLEASSARDPDTSPVPVLSQLQDPSARWLDEALARVLSDLFAPVQDDALGLLLDEAFSPVRHARVAPVLDVSVARQPPLDEPFAQLLDRALVIVLSPPLIPLLDKSPSRELHEPFASLAGGL